MPNRHYLPPIDHKALSIGELYLSVIIMVLCLITAVEQV